MDCTFCTLLADPAADPADPAAPTAPTAPAAPAAPIHQVLRDEVALAFLDRRPLFPGHLLVVPVRHVGTLTELPAELVGPFFGRVRLLTEAVELAMAARGSFVAMNNRVSQSVPHLHVHVVPRNPKDGLRGFFWPRHRYHDEAQARQTAELIRERVADLLAAAPSAHPFG